MVYSDAQIIPGEAYLSPAFEGGRNVFCATDEKGNLVGYAPFYLVLMRDTSSLPHMLRTEIKVRPGCDALDEIKDQLWEQILLRAR